MCRNTCKECPWTKDDTHSKSWTGYHEKMKSVTNNENHNCHMISKDVWGLESNISEKTVCIGSLNKNKNVDR